VPAIAGLLAIHVRAMLSPNPPWLQMPGRNVTGEDDLKWNAMSAGIVALYSHSAHPAQDAAGCV
jgi:hypothetical protein